MIQFALKKISNVLVTLLGVSTFVFFLFYILPGDPSQMMLDQKSDSKQLELIQKKYGFNLPISHQYFYYLNDLSLISYHSKNDKKFNYYDEVKYGGFIILNMKNSVIVFKSPYLRTSYQKTGKEVAEIIKETLPNTIYLSITSILIAIFIGLFFGILSALNKDNFLDKFLQLFSSLGISIPSFFSAIIFSWFFGYVLFEYTNLNMNGNLYELDDMGEKYQLKIKNLILPSIVLGIRPIAIITQLMRSELIDVLNQNYIVTAKSKGLSTFKIVLNHGIKNSLNPVITAISGWFASLLAGSVFVEYIFGWKGIGKEIVESLNSLDIPVVMGAVLTIATIFIFINIVVDILYILIDPRINFELNK